MGCAIHIIVLMGADGPYKRGQASKPQNERKGNHEKQDIHDLILRRKAFIVTIKEDRDIAAAASRGVT